MTKANDTHNNSRIVFAITFFIFVFLTGCSQNSVSESLTSPDKMYDLRLVVKDSGAFIAPTAKLWLVDKNQYTGEAEKEVFRGKGGWPIKVEWYDQYNIILTFCDPKRVEYLSGIVENKGDDQISEIKLHVMTYEGQTFDDEIYCEV